MAPKKQAHLKNKGEEVNTTIPTSILENIRD